MAGFVRFRLEDGAPVLVNTERITCVTKHFKGRDKDRKAIWSEDQTDISFGDADTEVAVNEPFEQVCDKLTGGGNPETGTWVFKSVEDDENDPYGIFKRRWYCSVCDGWQTYGQTRYCPNCGKPMRCMEV